VQSWLKDRQGSSSGGGVLKRVRTMGELSWRFPRDCDDQEDIFLLRHTLTDVPDSVLRAGAKAARIVRG
jgi:hypothetical protein